MIAVLPGETNIPERKSKSGRRTKHMGDRSPKANQKKNTQKQNKADAADQKKQQAVAARQTIKK
jgi:hypothetical protein